MWYRLRPGSDDDSNEERRDSVDDVFVPRVGMMPHRRVQMSPSNESGVYSDTSVSSIPYPSSRHRISARRQTNAVEFNHTETNDENSSSSESIPLDAENGSHPPTSNPTPYRVDSKATDSGISTSSDMKNSPGTSRDLHPELLNNVNRASFYSTHSRDSDGSTPSSESDITNAPNPTPHLWKAPLVIKRKESNTSNDNPTKISKEGKTKRGMWRKYHSHSSHVSIETVETIDLSRQNGDRKFPKLQSLDDRKSALKTKIVPDLNGNSIDDEAL